MSEMMLTVEHVSKTYSSVEVMTDFSLQLKAGEIVCLLGPSGCGKTTLLQMVAGLTKIDSGRIISQSRRLAYVFQEDRLLAHKTVLENICFVRQEQDLREANRLLDEVGLKGFENSYPANLSGGMKQRCAIARAFYYHSDLLLMDEPFKSLDYSLRIELIRQLLSLWQSRQTSILFVTHDIEEALLLGHRLIVLSSRPTDVVGQIVIDHQPIERRLTDMAIERQQLIDWLS